MVVIQAFRKSHLRPDFFGLLSIFSAPNKALVVDISAKYLFDSFQKERKNSFLISNVTILGLY